MSRRCEGLLAAVLLAFAMSSQAAAQVAPSKEREVGFRNGAVELRGTLILPALQGPVPAVVFLHGSGPSTRSGARDYAEAFARLGVASLFFDKRGSGTSGGSWLTASLDDLAGDALAAVRYLKTEAGVDSSRIGFWGVSQAGWVATLAAAQSQDVAFMILISGGGASPLESERFSYEQGFERAGISQEEKGQASAVLDRYFRYLATGEGRQELVARLDGARATKWYSLAKLDQILPSEDNREKVELGRHLGPRAVCGQTQDPCLADVRRPRHRPSNSHLGGKVARGSRQGR